MYRIKQLILPLILLLLFMISYDFINNRRHNTKSEVSVEYINLDTTEVTVTNDVDTLLEFAEREMEKIVQSQNEKKLSFEETKKKFADCIRENYKLKQDTSELISQITFKTDTIEDLKNINFDLFQKMMDKEMEIKSLNETVFALNKKNKLSKLSNDVLRKENTSLMDSINTLHEIINSNFRQKKVEKVLEY